MESCPICGNTKTEFIIECDCGYSFHDNEIVNPENLRTYFHKIEKINWKDNVLLVLKIHQTQERKYGEAIAGSKNGWSYKNTGKLIDKKKSLISEDINLAKGVKEYPVLLKCRNKTQAKQMLKEEKNKDTIFSWVYKQFNNESDLQNHLIDNWENTAFCNEWFVENSKYYLEGVGEIDILARHRNNGSWLVIELKKSIAEDKTVGQIQRYMGWVKENCACNNEEVFGRIISGYPPNEKIRLALLNTENIEQQIYYLENGQIKFIDIKDVQDLIKFEKLPDKKKIELLKS